MLRVVVKLTGTFAELERDLSALPARERATRLRALAMVGLGMLGGKGLDRLSIAHATIIQPQMTASEPAPSVLQRVKKRLVPSLVEQRSDEPPSTNSN